MSKMMHTTKRRGLIHQAVDMGQSTQVLPFPISLSCSALTKFHRIIPWEAYTDHASCNDTVLAPFQSRISPARQMIHGHLPRSSTPVTRVISPHFPEKHEQSSWKGNANPLSLFTQDLSSWPHSPAISFPITCLALSARSAPVDIPYSHSNHFPNHILFRISTLQTLPGKNFSPTISPNTQRSPFSISFSLERPHLSIPNRRIATVPQLRLRSPQGDERREEDRDSAYAGPKS